MALKTTDNLYLVTFHPTSHANWATMITPPGIPPALAPYVVNGSSCPIYVIDAVSGTFAFPGGQAYGYDDSLLATSTAAMSKLTSTSDQGDVTLWAKDGAGSTYAYSPATGALSTYSVGEAGALKAFLP